VQACAPGTGTSDDVGRSVSSEVRGRSGHQILLAEGRDLRQQFLRIDWFDDVVTRSLA
jgi:hypothetical protein